MTLKHVVAGHISSVCRHLINPIFIIILLEIVGAEYFLITQNKSEMKCK